MRVEVEQRSDLDWSSEPNVLHAETDRTSLTEHVSVGPGKLKSLSHDEASKDLVVQISILRLTNLDILHPVKTT